MGAITRYMSAFMVFIYGNGMLHGALNIIVKIIRLLST